MNLNNLSVSQDGISLVDDATMLTIADVCIPLKQVYYLTEMVVLNRTLAKKLKKSNLEGSFIMVRASKELLYDSSEQIEIGQTRIMGFLRVDELICLSLKTKWATYKIYQAVKAQDLKYI